MAAGQGVQPRPPGHGHDQDQPGTRHEIRVVKRCGEHVAASLAAYPEARVIKVSDFTDNAVGLIHTTGPNLRRLAGKYAPLVPVLRELINCPDTPLDADVKGAVDNRTGYAGDRAQIIQFWLALRVPAAVPMSHAALHRAAHWSQV